MRSSTSRWVACENTHRNSGLIEPARGGGVVAEQCAHAPPLHEREQANDLVAALLRQLAHEVGRVVGLHAREHFRHVGVGALLDELLLVIRLELLEDIRLELGVAADRAEDLLPLVVRGLLDEVRELGRMEPRELRVGHAQAHARHVAGEGLDRGPVEEFVRPDRVRKGSRDDPAQKPAKADVDADDAIPAVESRELDLVRTDEPGAVDIDQLPVEHVLLQEHLVGAPFERLQVEPSCAHADAAVLDLRDRIGGDEHLPSGEGGEEAGDGRVLVLAQPDDEVVDAAELRACGVEQVAARDEREVEDARSRGGRRFHVADLTSRAVQAALRASEAVPDDLRHLAREVGDERRALLWRQALPHRGAEHRRVAVTRLEVIEVLAQDRVVEIRRIRRARARVGEEREPVARENPCVLRTFGRARRARDRLSGIGAVARHRERRAVAAAAASREERNREEENPYAFHTPDHLSGWRPAARFRRNLECISAAR